MKKAKENKKSEGKERINGAERADRCDGEQTEAVIAEMKKAYTRGLIKCAKGFDVEEVVDEYVADAEGGLTLAKRKVSKKFVPPDLSAIKVLVEKCGESADEFARLSDEEIQKEKQRLLMELNNQS